ncbi:glycyl-tRNA synthetase [Conidiobolus coronatus NRRL 28638]|uniref:glycine--tRNA ligase n=1 Tax=Conidiobolus coronatus (strain ATCC 28846 / CBS 209.66 / NRRL 28638) TaxID=796925 RepID=A0A137PCC5_CONC2|nr:glycyl-tRNA synthetase [Conidiobolus coronatus NRRL 28638]|eukprot:KXN72622.1 glycyl-tRNA synthetase [Conidiobolus coronatus NRRL 28638]
MSSQVKLNNEKIDRALLDSILLKRFFYVASFALYGGVAGLYDYGPLGCSLQANILELWRKHFVLEEDMMELDCAITTPHKVLETSGHVAKFADWMVKDTKTGDLFRADHVVEGFLEAKLEGDRLYRLQQGEAVEGAAPPAGDKKPRKKKNTVVHEPLTEEVKAEIEFILAQIDNYDGAGLGELIKKYNITSPEANNPLSEPVAFNLMFDTSIGPSGNLKGYLRPETAQGQFLNFKKLLEYSNEKLPFASAQIGRSFRNEISPRSGLLRVREFTMAEIEHFVDPDNKNHSRFDEVKDYKLRLLSAEQQLKGITEVTTIPIGEAVSSKLVDNETLGYFLVRIHKFLTKIGINPDRLRFRQHLNNEMAHYACDCWDAEIHTSYGWIECVGCADRSAYDLTVHAKATGQSLVVREALKEPLVYDQTKVEINEKAFGPALKKGAKPVRDYLLSLSESELEDLQKQFTDKLTVTGTDNQQYDITTDMVSIKRVTVKTNIREYVPSVIEPSFGIGRIFYSLIEHSFWSREGDEQRSVLSFPIGMAPIKCTLLPLSNNEVFNPFIKTIGRQLRDHGISTKTDDSSASIGRRYARNDEVGTPLAITIDFQTVQDNTVTLRERDSTKQIRQPVDVVVKIIKELVEESTTWEQVISQYPLFTQQEVSE